MRYDVTSRPGISYGRFQASEKDQALEFASGVSIANPDQKIAVWDDYAYDGVVIAVFKNGMRI